MYIVRHFANKEESRISEVRKWCRANMVGGYHVESLRVRNIESYLASLVRIEDIEDQLLFKLYWHDYRI